MTESAAVVRSYALLADGVTVEIRSAGPSDFDRVLAFHQEMSPDNLYLRFFSLSKRAAEQEAQRVCRPPGPDHAALLALLDDKVAGGASYEPTARTGAADVAFAVADQTHGPPDLAIVAVPAPSVLDVAQECGKSQVKALVVIARPDGVVAVDARIRVTRHGSADPFLCQPRSAPARSRDQKPPPDHVTQT